MPWLDALSRYVAAKRAKDPNQYGGRERKFEAIDFLRRFNRKLQGNARIQTIAEESTSYPMVSRPTHLGGWAFGMKGDMGWTHDPLDYFSTTDFSQVHHIR